jgi:hypothetical protein
LSHWELAGRLTFPALKMAAGAKGVKGMDKKAQRLMVLKMICQVFVLDDEQKWQYLNSGRPWAPFMFNETGETTDEPLQFFCHAAYECTERFRDRSDQTLSELVCDLATLLNTVIEINVFFIWQDPRTRVMSGSADR